MKSSASMKAWAPRDRPDLLLLLNPQAHPPRSPDEFLEAAAETLEVLVAEASPEEIKLANNRLRDLLPAEMSISLPPQLLSRKGTPRQLFLSPAQPDSRLADLKEELPEVLKQPTMLKTESDKLKPLLTLESFLSLLT